MNNVATKFFGPSILALALIFAGAAVPAQAATFVSPSATTPSAVTAGAVTVPLTISVTTVSGSAAKFFVVLPTGWTTSLTGGPSCPGVTITGMTNAGCTVGLSGSSYTFLFEPTSAIATNTVVAITFPANSFTATSNLAFNLTTQTANGGTVDNAIVNLSVASSSTTVTFDSNGGTGAMANQTASSATALSANAFTRSGYTFAGWNTAADGSGTAYADAASFPFSANATLYAQWTADSSSSNSASDASSLATTGFDSAPYLFSGLGLAVVGGAVLLIARRKQNS